MGKEGWNPNARIQSMRDDLGLELVEIEVEIGKGAADLPLETFEIWPQGEDDDEDNLTIIEREIDQYLEGLEYGKLQPDKDTYEDLADLIALMVNFYRELVEKEMVGSIEHQDDKRILAHYESFFESQERQDEMLVSFADERRRYWGDLGRGDRAHRWNMIGWAVSHEVSSRGGRKESKN